LNLFKRFCFAADFKYLHVFGIGMNPFCMIVGGHRCGTTSLYNYLVRSGVCRPGLCKEPGFFSNRKGRTWDWYENGLKMNGMQPGVIDATVAYLFTKTAPKEIFEYRKDIKPIALLRNPVNRTWSAYWQYPLKNLVEAPLVISYDNLMNIKNVDDYRKKIMQELSGVPSMPENRMLLHNGMYVYGLDRWKEYFPDMLVIKSEDMFKQPTKVFLEVMAYLEIDLFTMPEFKKYYSCSKGKQPDDIKQLLEAYFEPYNELLYERHNVRF